MQKRCQISNPNKVKEYTEAYPLILFLFEATMINGINLEDFSFIRRRKILESFIGLQHMLHPEIQDNIRITPIEYKEKRKMYEWCVRTKGWEGVILKALNGKYHSGQRTFDQIKIKARDHTIHTLPNNGII